MGVRAVFAEFTLALLDPELTLLGLVVVILYIHDFEDELGWQWLNQNYVRIVLKNFWFFLRHNKT